MQTSAAACGKDKPGIWLKNKEAGGQSSQPSMSKEKTLPVQ